MMKAKQDMASMLMFSPRRVLQGGVVLAFLALMIARTVVLGLTPSVSSIPRVPNPPLSADLANLPVVQMEIERRA